MQNDADRFIALYEQWLDEPDAEIRSGLQAEMDAIERKYGGGQLG